MRILKIIHGYPPNYNAGSEVYSQSVCNEFSKNHDVFIITREENPYMPDFNIRKYKDNEHLSFFYINIPHGKDGYRHSIIDSQLYNIFNDIKPDIAHIGHLNHLSTGIIDELCKLRIPIVFTLHDFWLMCPRGQFLQRNFGSNEINNLCDHQENEKCAVNCYSAYFSGHSDFLQHDISYWSHWIEQRMNETKSIVKKTDLFIAPSKYLLNRFVNDFNVPSSKIKYLDYGFPLEYLTPSQKKNESDLFTFGYIGTHIPSKGINILIEAFKKLKGKCKLIIWGWKDQQSTEALVNASNESINPIEFRGGYINKNLANEVFSIVDCIVAPSIWTENSPLVIHEAQSCHIPVITADTGGMAEYVEHLKNGLLFKHRNFDSLAQQLQWAIEHPVLMKEFGKVGYLFSADGKVPEIKEHCQQLISLYNQTIAAYAK